MLYRLLTPSVSCVLLSFLDYRDYSTFTASSRQLNLLLNRAAVLAGQVYRPPSSSPLLLFRILIGFDHRFHVSVNGYGEDDGLDLVWLRSARTALALALMPSPEPDSPWSRPAAYVLEAELRSGRMMQAMMAQPGLQGCVETLIRCTVCVTPQAIAD